MNENLKKYRLDADVQLASKSLIKGTLAYRNGDR
jgi:hypothetical protein